MAVTPDVAGKLLASGLPEQHVVVVVTVDWLGPFSSIEAGALPKTAPTLPVGVDCLWMVTLKQPPVRAIYWLGDQMWRDIVLTQEQLMALTRVDPAHVGKPAYGVEHLDPSLAAPHLLS